MTMKFVPFIDGIFGGDDKNVTYISRCFLQPDIQEALMDNEVVDDNVDEFKVHQDLDTDTLYILARTITSHPAIGGTEADCIVLVVERY